MNQKILADLRKVLTTLYPDEFSIRRIVADSGIDSTGIVLNSTAANTWHSVLIEAEKLDRVETLLGVVEGEYPSNQKFRQACDAYRQVADETGRTNVAPPVPGKDPFTPNAQPTRFRRQHLLALLLGLLFLIFVLGSILDWQPFNLSTFVPHTPEAQAAIVTITPVVTPTLSELETQSIATATVTKFSPTDTATPEDTPTSITMPTPIVETFYFTISIAAIANNTTYTGYTDLPLGRTTFSDIPFNLPAGQNSVTTQAEDLQSNPTEIRLTNLSIKSPRSVHLLLTGGHTRLVFKNKKIGEIRLILSDNQSHSVDLIPGINLREWKTYGDHNVTTTSAPNVAQVWTTNYKPDSSIAIIDMLTINIPSNYQNSTLVAIEIYDTSEQTVGDLNPAINLIGVTVLGIQ